MSHVNGSLVISIALIIALFMMLPVGADNVTTNVTTAANQTTVAPTDTTVPATVTTVVTNQTTVAPSQTTATPVNTTAAVTLPSTLATTANPATSGTTKATTGDVNVYSSPAGASILIDGVYAGTTPKTIQGVPAGNHILRLSLSGYNDYEGSIYVVPGQAAQGYGTLQPISTVLTAAATQPVIVPVIVPVTTPAPVPTQDPGPLGNSAVVAAVIGAIAVVIGSAATIFTHVKPPKKE